MFGPNRYVCDTLEEMRKSLGVLDIDYMDTVTFKRYRCHQKLLIEEAQTMVNRMEAALHDVGDVRRMQERRIELKKEIKILKAEKKKLKGTDDEE